MSQTPRGRLAIATSQIADNQEKRSEAIGFAYEKLSLSEQAIIKKKVKELRKRYKGIGPIMALEVLAVLGQYLNDKMET